MNVRAKRELYERVVIPTVMYVFRSVGFEDGREDVMEMRCLRSMCGVTRIDRLRNKVVRERGGVVEKLSERVDRKVTIEVVRA